MVKRKWQQRQELMLFAFRAPSTSHCTSPPLPTLTWRFFLANKTLDGGSGRGKGTRQPVATKPVASLAAAGSAGNFCLGQHAQCDWLAASGQRRVIDLFPSSPPLPFLPFPCWVHRIPQLGSGWLQQGAPSAASQSAKSKRGS